MPIASTPDTKRRGLGCAIILVAPLLYYAAQAVLRTPPLAEAQVVAHRGGLKYAPENTLNAFRSGIERGADGLELDVQMTKDGMLVVIHDETVDRTTDGTGEVRDLTLEEIRALDAGEGEQVPTFAEVIQVAKAANVLLMPEAKSPHLYRGMEAKMLEALTEAGYLERAIIQSFDAASLQRLRQQSTDVQLCALQGLWGFDVTDPAGDAQFVCPMAEMVLLSPTMIRQAHSEGRQVFVWFLALESPLTVGLLRFFGADGFILDDPTRLGE